MICDNIGSNRSIEAEVDVFPEEEADASQGGEVAECDSCDSAWVEGALLLLVEERVNESATKGQYLPIM